jgi:hypothetical protein
VPSLLTTLPSKLSCWFVPATALAEAGYRSAQKIPPTMRNNPTFIFVLPNISRLTLTDKRKRTKLMPYFLERFIGLLAALPCFRPLYIMYTIFLPNLVVCVWLYLTFCLWMVGVFVVLFTSTLWITSDVASPVIFLGIFLFIFSLSATSLFGAVGCFLTLLSFPFCHK